MADRWTPEEVAFLHREAASSTLKELAEQLGRDRRAVRWKCKQEGLHFRDARPSASKEALTKWTPERLAWLAEQVATRPQADVAAELGLSKGGLADVLFRYKIKGRGVSRKHTPEEVEIRVSPLRDREYVDWSAPKVCTQCRELKQPEDFPADRNAASRCLQCRALLRNERWASLDPEEKARQVAQSRLTRYRLTSESYQELMDKQDGCCALCSAPFPVETIPHIDHDHSCCSGTTTRGKCVRGLLCQRCNMMIGWYEVILREGRLPRIEAYLTQRQEVQVASD